MDKVRKVVDSIIDELDGRKGFDFYDFDEEILEEIKDELVKLILPVVVDSKTLSSKIANKRERIKGDLQNAKNIINGNKGMSSDYIIDKTRNMPFLRCKLNLIDEMLGN